jgi:hypothetical protein
LDMDAVTTMNLQRKQFRFRKPQCSAKLATG